MGHDSAPCFSTDGAGLIGFQNSVARERFGKRDGAKDVLDYIRDGYLPETMMSFIATMGWNDGTEQEVFTKAELIEKFSLSRVQKSGARFDEKRLTEALLGLSDMNIKLRQGGRGYEKLEEILVRLLA